MPGGHGGKGTGKVEPDEDRRRNEEAARTEALGDEIVALFGQLRANREKLDKLRELRRNLLERRDAGGSRPSGID